MKEIGDRCSAACFPLLKQYILGQLEFSYPLASVCFNPSCLVWGLALTKEPINEFNIFIQSRQQLLRAHCPNIFTVILQSRALI